MPKSAVEIIDEHRAQEAAREAAAGKTDGDKLVVGKQRQDERKRKLQQAKEVADRVLRESGVLEELKAIKQRHINGNFPSSALFINYGESQAELVLAWGEFRVVKRYGRTSIESVKSGLFGTGDDIGYDYKHITARIDVNTEELYIGDSYMGSRSLDREKINDCLANKFMNPSRAISSNRYNARMVITDVTEDTSMHGGGGGSGGAGG